MEDIRFMTMDCKFGATTQRKFLEGKYPSHPIHSKDLYAAIQKFQPTSKSLSNDATKISNWLDQQKEMDSQFYKCLNSFAEDAFQQQFDKLIQNYPNARTYLEFLYKSKTCWAHCFTSFKFTRGKIPSSRVESVNTCLKHKENEYRFWQLAIPSIKNQQKTNFLFTKIDQSTLLENTENAEIEDEENQSMPSDEITIDITQATLRQLIKFVGIHNIKKYGQIVILTTSNAVFHIRLIPSRWYLPYLSLFNQDNKDLREERLTIFEQKIVYGKLHGTYKKALSKALQTNSKSQQLINLLQEFIENEDTQQENDTSDKENDPSVPLLQNPKKRRDLNRLMRLLKQKTNANAKNVEMSVITKKTARFKA
ncbi:10774_t:CDS:2 [Funneliformis caledonium]|uniref:10774_t:CDS:1 n=1 Tax=Funneliformis caledonium TaxID=1117310 RepID=A0A9N8ZB74_9GLOM|nr:10774_t:CDS:2 [Funneliformis caledonium]